jgi:hypothetical protein
MIGDPLQDSNSVLRVSRFKSARMLPTGTPQTADWFTTLWDARIQSATLSSAD